MDRYQMAKNRHQKTAPKKPEVEAFGFDSDPLSAAKKLKPYYAPPGEEVRVGLVYADPTKVFTTANIHFYNRRAFLCKSRNMDQPGGQREICCSHRQAVRRIACPIVIYHNDSGSNFEVRAWVFGNLVFQKIRELHYLRPIDKNDFYLTRGSEAFNPWNVRYLNVFSGPRSFWLETVFMKDRVLKEAEPILKNIKSYLGQDLNTFEIRQLLAEPERDPYPRSAGPRIYNPAPVQQQRRDTNDFDEFFNTLRSDRRDLQEEVDEPPSATPVTPPADRSDDIDLGALLADL